MKIISRQKDKAKKYRVWVETSEGKAEMIKFDAEVTDDEAITKATEIQEARKKIAEERQLELDEQIAKLQAEKELLN